MHLCKQSLKVEVKWKTKTWENKFLDLLLFIDFLFTEVATSFLIPYFSNNMSLFVEAVTSWSVLKVSVYQKSSP